MGGGGEGVGVVGVGGVGGCVFVVGVVIDGSGGIAVEIPGAGWGGGI